MFQKTLRKYTKGHESGRQPSESADIQPEFIQKPFPIDLDHSRFLFITNVIQNNAQWDLLLKRSIYDMKC